MPVLSSTMCVSPCACSRASTSLMRMPPRVAAPDPVMMAVGVASPRAHGQAMTRTRYRIDDGDLDTGTCSKPAQKGDDRNGDHDGYEDPAYPVRQALNGRLSGLAFSTRRIIRARVESAPVARASMVSRPSMLRDPATTGSPSRRETGTLSPVTSDSSTSATPLVTMPSAATWHAGAADEAVPHPDIAQGLFVNRAVFGFDESGSGPQSQQFPDGLRRTAPCPHLQLLADEDQGDDDGRGLEIEMPGRGIAQRRVLVQLKK